MSLITIPGGPFVGRPVEQTDWYVDHENGDDRAPGTAGDPVASVREIARRTRGMVFDEDVVGAFGAYTINHAVGSTPNAEDVALTPFFNGPVYLFVRSTPSVAYSGALTAGTLEWSDSGHQEINAVSSGIPTSWTASGLVGKQMRIPIGGSSGGARDGNATFVGSDIGSKTVVCAGWTAPGYYNDTAVSGDAFEVVTTAYCSGKWTVQGFGPGVVWFEDIEIGGRGNLHDVLLYSRTNTSRARINGCDVKQGGDLYTIGSLITGGLRPEGGQVTLELTYLLRAGNNPLNPRQLGILYVYEQNVVDGGGVLFDQASSTIIDSAGSLSSMNAANAYSFQPGAKLDCLGYMWSRNASGRVLSVGVPGCDISYQSGRAPLNVGTGSPTLLVMGGSSYASVPQTDSANGYRSRVVVRA